MDGIGANGTGVDGTGVDGSGTRAVDRRPKLLEPVGPASRVGACSGVRYSEIDGSAVLWEPSTRVLHELTPAGAGLWASFDGRTLAEIVADAARSMDADERLRFERDATEIVRRLRALGLVEDLGDDPPPLAGDSIGMPPSVVRLAGRLATGAGKGVAVVLTPLVDADGEPAAAFVEIDVNRATTLAVTDPEVGTQADERTLVALHAPPDTRPAGRGADAGGEPRAPLGRVTLLAALMASVPTEPEPHPLVLDALASLAESVPGFVMEASGAER